METLPPLEEGAETEDEPFHFAYSATLRIFGESLDFEAISAALGLLASNTHRKGDPGRVRLYDADLWSYTAPLDESEPLHKHIDALWAALKPNKRYLLLLKQRATVDVFLGYRSDCEWAGVEVPHSSLELFTQLEIPFGLSIVIA
jgi:hypothetical protein